MDIFVCEWCGFIHEKITDEDAADLCICCGDVCHEGMDRSQWE